MNINLIHKRRFSFLTILFFLIIPFQNCNPLHSNMEDGTSESTSVSPEPTQVDRFQKAQLVLQNKCLSCHTPGGVASFSSFNLSSEQAFIDSGLVVPGDVNNSLLILRSQFSGGTNSNMPTDQREYSREDFLALYYWVREMNKPDPIIEPPVVNPDPGQNPEPIKSPMISSFNIINSQTQEVLFDKVAGVVNVNYSEMNFAIKLLANTNADVMSTRFKISGALTSTLEDNSLPYEVFSNGQMLNPGTYLFEATPYSQVGLAGVNGSTVSLTLNIIDDRQQPQTMPLDLAIHGFTIINADTDTVFASGLTNSVTLELSKVGFNINIEAISGLDVASVELALTGPITHNQQENLAPYALFPQPSPTNYDGRMFGPGTYILTATAYEKSSLMGQKGLAQSLTITIVDDTPPPPVDLFMAAKGVLQAHCVQCHSPGGSASQLPLNFATEEEYIASGLVTPGDIDKSKLVYRMIHYKGSTFGPQNMPSGSQNQSQFSLSDYQTVADWVNQIKVCTTREFTAICLC